jgi:hypothetical protein
MKVEKEEDYICENVMDDGMKGWNCIYDIMWIGKRYWGGLAFGGYTI